MAAAGIWSRSGKSSSGTVFALEGEGHGLADTLPEIMLEALRVSTTVTHGIHGRRRAGPGETFWQFRHAQAGDAAQLIDWRRSASSDHLFVREREWEAAHTIWLWPDLSPSMRFHSHLSSVGKRDRALVLMFALAELLVRSGERIAMIGLTLPSASRKATSRIAERLAAGGHGLDDTGGLPPEARMARFSSAILIGDFLRPAPAVVRRIDEIAAGGVNGYMIQVLDPAEETLPYDGRTEFIAMDGSERFIADRAETVREEYARRLAAHRAEITEAARRVGWSFLVHHTDRPASEPLLALIMRLQGLAGNYRWSPAAAGGAE